MNISALKCLADAVTGVDNKVWEEIDNSGYKTTVIGTIDEDGNKNCVLSVNPDLYKKEIGRN